MACNLGKGQSVIRRSGERSGINFDPLKNILRFGRRYLGMGLGRMVLVDFQTVLIPLALDAGFPTLATSGLLQVALVMCLVICELPVLICRSWNSGITWNLHLSSVFYRYGMLLTDQPPLPSRWESTLVKWRFQTVGGQENGTRSGLASTYSTGDR